MNNKEAMNEDQIINEDNNSMWKDAFDAAKMFEGKDSQEDAESEISENEINQENADLGEESAEEPVKAKKETREEGRQETGKDSSHSKEIAALKQKLEEKEIQFKRLAADFDNYRRRQAIEKEDLLKYGSERTVLEILPVLDNFERAVEASKNATEVASIVAGIEMIHKQLADSLKKEGVDAIEAMGNIFDPNFHEAVQQMVDNDKPEQTIIHEIRKGYTLNGRVIRPSMVVVSTVSEE